MWPWRTVRGIQCCGPGRQRRSQEPRSADSLQTLVRPGNASFSRASRKKHSPADTLILTQQDTDQTSSFQNCEIINLCCFKHPLSPYPLKNTLKCIFLWVTSSVFGPCLWKNCECMRHLMFGEHIPYLLGYRRHTKFSRMTPKRKRHDDHGDRCKLGANTLYVQLECRQRCLIIQGTSLLNFLITLTDGNMNQELRGGDRRQQS